MPPSSGTKGGGREPVGPSGQRGLEKAGRSRLLPHGLTLLRLKTFYLRPPCHSRQGQRVILRDDGGHGPSSFPFKKMHKVHYFFFSDYKSETSFRSLETTECGF